MFVETTYQKADWWLRNLSAPSPCIEISLHEHKITKTNLNLNQLKQINNKMSIWIDFACSLSNKISAITHALKMRICKNFVAQNSCEVGGGNGHSVSCSDACKSKFSSDCVLVCTLQISTISFSILWTKKLNLTIYKKL